MIIRSLTVAILNSVAMSKAQYARMAYDPKDAADKKIVDKLIADALAAQAEEHETDIAGLKTKNTELLGKIKELRKSGGDPAEVERLETALETAKAELKTANKQLTAVTKERDTYKTQAETEATAARNLLVNQGLTDALVSANVGKSFLPAVRKLLESQVTIKAEGENRVAMVGDKPLGEFVKTWSQSDEGKVYVVAPANGGGNAPGGKAGGSGKTMPRSVYEQNPASHAAFFKEGGTLTDG